MTLKINRDVPPPQLIYRSTSSRLGATGESEFGPFVGSKFRNLFHLPDCKWMQEVRIEHIVEFSSHAEAVEAGRKPCKTCKS